MAGFFGKVSAMIKGKTDRAVDKMMSPEDQIRLFVEETNKQISTLQKAVAAAMADEKRLKMQLDDLIAKADSWEKKAMLALENGDEFLAKEALLKKEEFTDSAREVLKDWETQRDATVKLKQSLGKAKKQVEDSKRKYNLLAAQYKAAEAKKSVADRMGSTDASSPLAAMEALNEKVLAMEADAEAAVELMGDPSSDALEAKFAAMERDKKGDDALAALKAKMGH
ncbi:phage shock protein A (PspA) family protein [Desulfatibacillum alkenivorans DSM 16219]|uniref:Phage shock protein A (PspA) family protein n=1 Tax=Desulfatibacillum alkenivorans DSM 16219 TaxID=1121393 RepID=A0A1M6JT34_9BACT|nr:PspA/IM30 family protein [Desulfatibacillum alkenivorans]SHJ49868.1 phage shock protein A (PspA) family protein [Desulfatibacillum alkenivorans DSM 16219]